MTTFHDFEVKTIDGEAKKLADFAGKVTLVVNVASECGLTPQYTGLEKLYEELHGKGFEIAGFPANEFGAQEPGTDAQIQSFCTTKYGVKFPMFSKIVVKGAATSSGTSRSSSSARTATSPRASPPRSRPTRPSSAPPSTPRSPN
jgi:glutathione peroxidase